ncbi:MAG: LysR family transcriptional regulator [Massilia sp.]
MDRFAEINAFCLVASNGGFSAAARQLGMATSSVTRLVDALEQRLGAPLLNRSTRSVTLTDRGALYFEQAAAILDNLAAADDGASADSAGVQGLLRVSAPVTFAAMHVGPVAAALHALHPRLELDLRLSDMMSNMVDESIDVAIRIGALDDQPNLIARRLMDHQRVICASPAYLAQHGAPQQPADLAGHNCLRFAYDGARTSWRLQRGEQVDSVAVRGTLIANNAEVLRQAAIGGAGIALLARWLVDTDLAAGRLVPVLADYRSNPGPMNVGLYAIYPANRRGSPKVRVFVDALATHLAALHQAASTDAALPDPQP